MTRSRAGPARGTPSTRSSPRASPISSGPPAPTTSIPRRSPPREALPEPRATGTASCWRSRAGWGVNAATSRAASPGPPRCANSSRAARPSTPSTTSSPATSGPTSSRPTCSRERSARSCRAPPVGCSSSAAAATPSTTSRTTSSSSTTTTRASAGAPTPLSGGETFLTSLALALQLSEQIQRAAGAVRLDSLFIDEGFGTLDPETLATVSDAIQQLGRGHRMVGIITHVQDLTSALPARIEVVRGSDGSRIKVISEA
ncbi:MAG: hypothetical protein E6J90_38830 [Deltaproteobacteria bacterium]|nr:MAG: hypothetical protein E6J90_38830 [Deltaproteobacteria bacterium]TMQ12223.1 MAG: hypothetical protein E6J91_21295 [Deltaproteobacteria bacterium]